MRNYKRRESKTSRKSISNFLKVRLWHVATSPFKLLAQFTRYDLSAQQCRSADRTKLLTLDSQPIQKFCCSATDFCHVGPTFSKKSLYQSRFTETGVTVQLRFTFPQQIGPTRRRQNVACKQMYDSRSDIVGPTYRADKS